MNADLDEHHHRRTIRLPGFDYRTPATYFVTLCTYDRLPLFGAIENGVVHPNDLGRLVEEEWKRSAGIREEITLDEFIVMPNHLHGLVHIIVGAQGLAPLQPSAQSHLHRPPRSLGSFISGFKRGVIHRAYREGFIPHSTRLWQRNYYERIVRDEEGLMRAREYIQHNPLQWEHDRENPNRVS